MDPNNCAQNVSFASPRMLSEHAIKLHGATFTGEEAHQADHRFAAAVKGNMELQAGAAYKISHLLLFEHFHDESGYAVMRYFPARAPRRHQENGHESLL
jgi:hypothetical protein